MAFSEASLSGSAVFSKPDKSRFSVGQNSKTLQEPVYDPMQRCIFPSLGQVFDLPSIVMT